MGIIYLQIHCVQRLNRIAKLHEMPQVNSHAASNRTAALECQRCPYRFKGCRDFQQAVEEARCQ